MEFFFYFFFSYFHRDFTFKGLLFHTYSQTLLERYQQRFYIDIACPAFSVFDFLVERHHLGSKNKFMVTQAPKHMRVRKVTSPKEEMHLLMVTAPTTQKYAMLKTRLYNVTCVVYGHMLDVKEFQVSVIIVLTVCLVRYIISHTTVK